MPRPMIRFRDNTVQWLDWESNPRMIRSSSLRHCVQTGSWVQRIYRLDITDEHVDQTCNSLKKPQEVWSKHGVLYNKYKNIVQLAGSEICVYWTTARKICNIKSHTKFRPHPYQWITIPQQQTLCNTAVKTQVEQNPVKNLLQGSIRRCKTAMDDNVTLLLLETEWNKMQQGAGGSIAPGCPHFIWRDLFVTYVGSLIVLTL